MSDKKSKCCKDFDDSACPCLDQKTGERSCQTDKQTDKPKNNGCGDCGCAPKPPAR